MEPGGLGNLADTPRRFLEPVMGCSVVGVGLNCLPSAWLPVSPSPADPPPLCVNRAGAPAPVSRAGGGRHSAKVRPAAVPGINALAIPRLERALGKRLGVAPLPCVELRVVCRSNPRLQPAWSIAGPPPQGVASWSPDPFSPCVALAAALCSAQTGAQACSWASSCRNSRSWPSTRASSRALGTRPFSSGDRSLER